ncbi:MAG TPA: glycosyltransferase family 39 protein [Caldilineaceae bacterium]|nr:glycosyltransferase family 39 protein [Caldilineaceae bacterium]
MRAIPARKEAQRALHPQVQTAAPPRLWRFLTGVAALLLALAAQRALNQRIWFDTALLGGGAVALWLWAYGADRRPSRHFVGDLTRWWPRWQIGLVGLAASTGLAVWRWRVLDVNAVTTEDWLWYLRTIGVAVAAVALIGVGNRGAQRETTKNAKRAQDQMRWLVWTLVAGGALLLRLYGLEQIPFGTWYDEAANGLEALRVVSEPAYRPIYTDGVNATGHYLWLIAGAFKLFGVNTAALRLISALMGTATVIAAYGVGKELYGRTAGVAAAVLFATGHWSLTFSRLGMYNASTPLFALATLYFLLVGLRRNAPLAYGLAGVCLGLGLCFYSAFQLFVVVLAFFVVWVVWRERARWRNFVPGLAVMALCAALVLAPVVKFALEKPELYFARVRHTSIFTGKAPEERLPAVLENARKHLLMFNVAGDPNGRHNLPGAPMVDTLTGGLLALGTALAIRRMGRPEMALLPVWLLAGLAGGIFSLDFEAPQSLRSIGAQPAVYLLAALPLQELAAEWVSGAGRYYPAVAWRLAAAVLAPIALLNVHTYFYRQTHDFPSWNNHSTPETITARLLRDLGDDVQAYVISLYDHHPTVRFLAAGAGYRRLETNATLPLLEPATQPVTLILDGERGELFAEVKRLYPQGEFEEVRPPFGGPAILYVAHLGLDDLTSIQGLNVTYTGENGAIETGRDETVNVVWPDGAPLPLPFSAEWEGILAVKVYGAHEFYLRAPGQAELVIDGETVASGDAGQEDGLAAGVILARGNHTLRLRAEGGHGQVTLAWRTPENSSLAGVEVTPPWALYVPPVRANGLLGQYYANGDWQPPVAFAQVDPRLGMYFHIPLLPRPYTVEWTGLLAVPESGRYGFALESIDESVLFIDGVEVAASRARNEFSQGEMELNEGLHEIRVRYADRTDHTYINLYWRPPVSGREPAGGRGYQIIPPDFLFPPQVDHERIEIPPLPLPALEESAPVALTGEAAIAPASVEVILDGLNQPRGVAVLGETVFVAESGAGRVLAVPLDGGEPWPLPAGGPESDAPPMREPFDLAVDADGNLVVLDAGEASLLLYTPEGDFAGAIPADKTLLERARGIGVDEVGRIWIAGTPSQRVAAVDRKGAVVSEIAIQRIPNPGQEIQPVDVTGASPDRVYVTDAGNHRLYLFALGGGLLATTELPAANSLDGPHLATSAQGSVYMTAPEPGHVVEIGAPAELAPVYSVRTPATPQAKPVGIAVDRQGHIWVTDVQGGRLLRLIPEGNSK